MQRQITHATIIEAAHKTLKASMYFRFPATVVKYYPGTMTVDAQIMTNDPRTDLDTGAMVGEPWPVIMGIGVTWPRIGKFCMVGQLSPLDPLILEAFDLDPNPAFAAGRSNNPVDPTDVRRLSGNYWSASPANLTGAIADASELASFLGLIGIDGDVAQILFEAGTIQAGKGATGYVALASAVATELGKIKTALASLSVTTGVGAGGTVVAATPYAMVGNVAATVLKAQ